MTLEREFNPAERVLLLLLGLLLVLLAYYRFVYRPVYDEIENAHTERVALQTELMAVQTRVAQLTRMREELDSIGTDADRMESYNNSKAELSLLNSSLDDVLQYSISFATVTRDGDQIRRNFTLQFTTDSFEGAQRVLKRLTASEYRCLLGDVQYTSSRNGHDGGDERVTVSTTATFFETMVGGTPDAGLPVDTGTAAQ